MSWFDVTEVHGEWIQAVIRRLACQAPRRRRVARVASAVRAPSFFRNGPKALSS